jgi:hypothetical protein
LGTTESSGRLIRGGETRREERYMRERSGDEQQSEQSKRQHAESARHPADCRKSESGSYFFKRIVGVIVFPALVMAGMARIAPNPDGVLVLALVCMFMAANYIKP